MNKNFERIEWEVSVDVWHVIGNGPGELDLSHNEKIVRFNQPFIENERMCLTITNSKVAGLKKGMLIQGTPPGVCFTERLAMNNRELEAHLGCKPSLGLLTIKTMLEYDVSVKVHRMALLPSLIRPQEYSERKALPAAYHNWLGERRLAQSLLDVRLIWPEFVLREPDKGSTDVVPDFSVLRELPNLPRDEAGKLWEKFSNVHYHVWLEQADHEKLKSVESLFYISRDSDVTLNWWMYDNQLSFIVSRLQKTLAFVQQVICLQSGVKV
ncbi:hypothetical protein [Photobacterium galatheae]|uniref:Uncharacterized protein n=1 Tax=Photobacterium galatheae TaxID=1654360 RepID=A0A066RJY3_9GAMM|nr:hypothetical protein [Photobacterium galatheae]KDM90725.1 hypothetical protein EA58_15165 [Photobacterium galatheae]MCM0149945.1 hypothetical protein [Photobacterium galatheae]